MQQVPLHVLVEYRDNDVGEDWYNKHPLSLAIRKAAQKRPPFQGNGLAAVYISEWGHYANRTWVTLIASTLPTHGKHLLAQDPVDAARQWRIQVLGM